MKIKLKRSYKKVAKSGKVVTVFVYGVSGSAEQLAKFKAANGDNFRADEDGTPLWFTTRFAGNTGELVQTAKGDFIADMSDYDAAASLSEQYGGNLGSELAKAAASKLMGGNTSVEAPTQAKESADLGKI